MVRDDAFMEAMELKDTINQLVAMLLYSDFFSQQGEVYHLC